VIFPVRHSVLQIVNIETAPIVKQVEYPMTGCFCLSRGLLRVRLALKRNIFMPGEKLRAKLTIDNCDVPIVSVAA
jgi:hypothetical protein